MSTIEQQVRRARRRLSRNLLFHRLCLGFTITAAAWALLVIIVRLFALNVPVWTGGGIAIVAGLLIGVVGMLIARPSVLQAAIALDEAAGLRERLSTALAMQNRPDPFVRATVKDAENTASRVHVPSHIRHQAPPLLPYSTATVVAALILAWFMPVVDLLADNAADQNTVPRAQVEAEHKIIQAEFEKRISRIEELSRDNADLGNLTEDLEPLEMPDQPTVTPDDVRREAAKRIDDVRDKLNQQLEQTESSGLNETKRMFQQLNRPGNLEASDQLAKSLASGDFQGAKDALQKLADDIAEAAKNAETPEAKQRLAEMQQRLERLSDQMSKLSDTVKLQKELENKCGLSEEQAKKLLDQMKNMDPKQLEKELQKQLGEKGVPPEQIQEIAKQMKAQQQAQKTCKNMAQSLAKAAQACQQCQNPGSSSNGAAQAGNALSDAASQLSQLEMSEQMMNELETQMSELGNLRDEICRGGMCPFGKDGYPGKPGMQGPGAGLGLGERIGKQRVAYDRQPTKVKSRFEGGTVIGRMLVEGPQVRGEATAEALATAQSEVRDALDNVEREDVPRQYHNALRAYFERLAGLMRADDESSTEDK